MIFLLLLFQVIGVNKTPGTEYSNTKTPNDQYGQKITQIKEMWCQISDIWQHDTRTVTCTLAGNDTFYTGTLTVVFSDTTTYSEYVTIEQSIINEVLEYWGVTAITLVNNPLGSAAKSIDRILFKANQPDVEWKNPYAPAPPAPDTAKNCHKFLWWKFCKPVTK